ncbi:MAG: hypothetical protein QME61_00755 [Patescibacteria group bacterium]|nr:hypothetical protein [Patescibacteria group bacterium]
MVVKKYEILDDYPSEKNENSYFVKVRYFRKEGIASGHTGFKNEKVIQKVPTATPGVEGVIVSFDCDNFYNPLADPSVVEYNFETQTETITFELIKDKGQWKLNSPSICPCISEETLKKLLKEELE